VLTRYSK